MAQARIVLRPRVDTAAVLANASAPRKPAKPWLLQALGAGIALIAVAVAIGSHGLAQRLAFLCVTALGVTLVFYAAAIAKATQQGTVGIASGTTERPVPLTFIPPTSVFLWETAMPLTGVAFGVCALIAAQADGASSWRQGTVWAVLFAGASVVFLIQLLARLRTPIGLTLTPEALEGVRGGDRIVLSWDQLDHATIGSVWRGTGLVLVTGPGNGLRAAEQYLGSDVAVVAGFIEHYRTHPEARADLTDGLRAVRALEQAPA